MGWGEPGWNWGSAIGEAHDLAAELRPRLGTPERRQQWIKDVVSAGSSVTLDEMKLAFGLRVQRCRRSDVGPFQSVLESMVRGEFEVPNEGDRRFETALKSYLEDYDSSEVAAALGRASNAPVQEEEEVRIALAVVLVTLGFVEGGM